MEPATTPVKILPAVGHSRSLAKALGKLAPAMASEVSARIAVFIIKPFIFQNFVKLDGKACVLFDGHEIVSIVANFVCSLKKLLSPRRRARAAACRVRSR